MLTPSVTTWVGLLRAGDAEAAQALWQRYYPQLVQLAHRHLAARLRRAGDEEDVALSAFAEFCVGAQKGRFPNLRDRHDLWRILFTLTLRKARSVAEHEGRQKRDAERTLAADELFSLADADLDRLAGDAPDPALAAEIADELNHLLKLLPGDDLRGVVVDLLAGYTMPEIAGRLGSSLRTVERRWQRIRQFWRRGTEA